jgi:hypothetical protein
MIERMVAERCTSFRTSLGLSWGTEGLVGVDRRKTIARLVGMDPVLSQAVKRQ